MKTLFSALKNYYSQINLTAKNCKNYAKILEIYLHYSNKHNKVFVLRLDFHFPQTINKKTLSTEYKKLYADSSQRNAMKESTLSYFIKALKRKKFDPVYLCATEISEESDYEHFHLLLLLDGNKTNNIYNHLNLFEKIWYKKIKVTKEQNAGLVQKSKMENDKTNTPLKYNGFIIKRNSPKFIEELLYAIKFSEYLIKDKQKEKVVFRKKINSSALCYDNSPNNPKSFSKELINSCRLKKEMNYDNYSFLNEKFKLSSCNNQEIEISFLNNDNFINDETNSSEILDNNTIEQDIFIDDDPSIHTAAYETTPNCYDFAKNIPINLTIPDNSNSTNEENEEYYLTLVKTAKNLFAKKEKETYLTDPEEENEDDQSVDVTEYDENYESL